MSSPIGLYWKGIEYNDAERLGITIKRTEVTGADKWVARCVVVHHLTKDQNKGNHNLYMDMIDEFGKRVKLATVKGDNNGIKLSAKIDKPDNEFGTNFSMYSQDTLSCWVDEAPGLGKIASDTVSGFHTRWGGDIVGGNDYGHNSYYVVWLLRKGNAITPPAPVPPLPIPTPPEPLPPPPTEPTVPPHGSEYLRGYRAGVIYAREKIRQLLNKL